MADNVSPANQRKWLGIDSKNALPPLRVQYYRRMKPKKVSPLVVTWPQRDKSRGDSKKITVRLLAAGAQIVPDEQTLESGDPASKATFFVTPLAKGWLRAHRLEIYHDGRKIQEIPLAANVAGQGPTWFLLALTFLVPWFILTYIHATPLQMPDKMMIHGKEHPITMPLSNVATNFLSDNLPATPEFIKTNFPALDDAIGLIPTLLADVYVQLVKLSRDIPLAFHAAWILFFLTLVSAWSRRQKCRRAWGKPLPIAAA